ncbi:hypothetical protein VIGAN_08170300, partial [Vigna angularis var. angularis]
LEVRVGNHNFRGSHKHGQSSPSPKSLSPIRSTQFLFMCFGKSSQLYADYTHLTTHLVAYKYLITGAKSYSKGPKRL